MGKSIALFGTSADPPTIGHKKYLKNYPKYMLLQLVMLVTTPTKITKRISQFVAIY